MRIDEPVLTSFLDDDFYKITTGAVVFNYFPRWEVTYNLIIRGDIKFPIGFDEELKRQVSLMQFLKISESERKWMEEKLLMLPPTYIEWLYGYRLDPKEVKITQVGSSLKVRISGLWFRAIFWEVKLMAVISSLYYRLTKQVMAPDWEKRIIRKAKNFESADAVYSDFGTRRRYDFITQDRYVDIARSYKTFAGTSNPYLAFKYNVPVVGTFPHEGPMAMSAQWGEWNATCKWLDKWLEYYQGELAASLTDTFTTEVFVNYFGRPDFHVYLAELRALRHDSGDPYYWTSSQIIPLYNRAGIDLKSKTLFYSDRLNDKSYIALSKKYSKIAHIRGGIGTFLSNDVGVKPLPIVIKMTSANFGIGKQSVIKLSDDKDKNTGDPKEVLKAKKRLNCTYERN